MKKCRLQSRKARFWSQTYLHYRYLWPNIERAIRVARMSIPASVPLILDIGCGHKPYRDLFQGCRYIGIDHGTVETSPELVGDAICLPISSDIFDIVFSSQVIEHVPYPGRMIAECYRILKPGGYLILTGPFYWPLHEEPNDFHRFTKYGFALHLKDAGFREWEIRADGGDWAQVMLALNLRLSNRWTTPLRCIVNLIGTLLDSLSGSRLSPCNYTILARR